MPTPLSLRTIFAEHAGFVLRTVRRLGVRPADVEDAAQEVFIVVHRKLEQFDPQYSMKSWLFGICSRVASDYRRKAHVRREQPGGHPELSASTRATQPEEVDRQKLRTMLDDALSTLDDAKREVFVLFELEHMPMEEVAQAVGCPLQTAYSRLYAARTLMRAAMEAALVGRQHAS